MKNYKIKYRALNKDLKVIKEGEVIAKKKISEFDAIAGYESHLENTLPGFYKLECLNIKVDTMLGFIPTRSKLSDTGFENLDAFINAFSDKK